MLFINTVNLVYIWNIYLYKTNNGYCQTDTIALTYSQLYQTDRHCASQKPWKIKNNHENDTGSNRWQWKSEEILTLFIIHDMTRQDSLLLHSPALVSSSSSLRKWKWLMVNHISVQCGRSWCTKSFPFYLYKSCSSPSIEM